MGLVVAKEVENNAAELKKVKDSLWKTRYPVFRDGIANRNRYEHFKWVENLAKAGFPGFGQHKLHTEQTKPKPYGLFGPMWLLSRRYTILIYFDFQFEFEHFCFYSCNY